MAEKDEKDKGTHTDLEFKLEGFDPEKLPDDLKPVYKSMRGSHTKSMQALSEARKDFDTRVKTFDTDNAEKLQNLGALEKEVQQWRAWSASLQTEAGKEDPNKSGKSPTGIDYDDEPGEKGHKEVLARMEKLQEEVAALKTSATRSSEEVGRMFKYQDALNELKVLHPEMDKEAVIKHMLESGQTDPHRAYKDVYQDDIIKGEVEKQMEEYKKDFEQKRKADMLTGPGAGKGTLGGGPRPDTPYKPQTEGKPKSWDESLDEVISDYRKSELGIE